MSMRSRGTKATTSRRVLRTLESDDAREGNVVAPGQARARATCSDSVKQWNTPPARLSTPFSPSSRRMARVSSEALRVWITRGLPQARAARICVAKTLTLPLQVGNAAPALAVFHAVVVEAGLADGPPRGAARRAVQQVLHRGLDHALVVGVHPPQCTRNCHAPMRGRARRQILRWWCRCTGLAPPVPRSWRGGWRATG